MKWKHNEPFFWMMFGAGGVVAAMVIPILILFVGVLFPLGIVPKETMDFLFIQQLVSNIFVKLLLIIIISFTAWHAFHRIVHGLHDLGFHLTTTKRAIGYGLALLITIACCYLTFII